MFHEGDLDIWVLIGASFLLDLVFGDPRLVPHPVVLIGKLVRLLEAVLHPRWEGVAWPSFLPTDAITSQVDRGIGAGRQNTARDTFLGAMLVAVVVGLAYGLTWLVVWGLYRVNAWAGYGASVLLMWSCIAARGLAEAGLDVYRALSGGGLSLARRMAGKIVGRDTGSLGEEELVRATVESVAENAVDGVISPLFYAFVGGPPLAMAYKAVNTMDSMIGYRDERYRDFGKAAARLDDLLNYLPARLGGVLITVSAGIMSVVSERGSSEMAGRVQAIVPRFRRGWHAMCEAWRIMRRDGRKHPSPNGGLPEAAMAGALGIRLGGTNYYGGIPEFRPYLGDGGNPLSRGHIVQAIRLMYVASVLTVVAGSLVALGIGVIPR